MLLVVEPRCHPAIAAARRARALSARYAAWALTVALALLAHAGTAAAADDVAVETQRIGDAVVVRARATLSASHDTIWSTLTDYDRIASFIPGFSESRVLSRSGRSAIVHQRGEARILFLSFPIDVVVESTELPPDAISVRALRGTLRQLHGTYRIAPLEGGAAPRFLLRWIGIVEPEEGLPPLFGEALMRANIEDQFLGMVREIERRAAMNRAAVPR